MSMKISTRGRYALRLLLDLMLQDKDSYVSLKEISSRQDISVKYLEQITSLLTKAGLLISTRGPTGGYKLAKSPDNIRVYDVMVATEGPLHSVACLGESENPCPRKDSCTALGVWEGLDKVVYDYLTSITLSDALTLEDKEAVNFSI